MRFPWSHDKAKRSFFAIQHLPTKSLFPYLAHGSSFYDFTTQLKHDMPPRLFRRQSDAARYIKEYCKGYKIGADERWVNKYEPATGRDPLDYEIVGVTISMSRL
jgi:hypothetical protein